MELIIHVFQEQVTEKMYALLYLKDIDNKKQQELKQKKDAYCDPLTNALNRRMFKQCIETNMINEATEGVIYPLLMLDLDNSKQVNDTPRNHGDDTVLKTFVNILQEMFHKSSYIGRLGGDEFSIFISQNTTKNTYQFEIILKQADVALYHCKRNGKDAFCYWQAQNQLQ